MKDIDGGYDYVGT